MEQVVATPDITPAGEQVTLEIESGAPCAKALPQKSNKAQQKVTQPRNLRRAGAI
jgi:hypothetical protein